MSGKSNKTFPVFVGITAVLLVFAVIVANRDSSGTLHTTGQLLLPDLEKRMDDVTQIIGREKKKSFRSEFVGGQWVLPTHNSYPVALEKIRGLVQNAAKLEIVEKKTNDPKKFAELGVEDPETDSADGVRLMFTADDTKTVLADFIVGHFKPIPAADDGTGYFYVRNTNGQQVWLVKGNLNLKLDSDSLLDTYLLKITSDRIKRASVESVSISEHLILDRENPNASFSLVAPNIETHVLNMEQVQRFAFVLSGLKIQDIAPIAKVNFATNKVVKSASFETFDGVRLVVHVLADGDHFWAKFDAVALSSASPTMHKQVEYINALTSKWVYEIAKESYLSLTLRPTDLLQ